MRKLLALAASLPLVCTAFLMPQTGVLPSRHRASSSSSRRRSLLSSGSDENLISFAVPTLSDGFPSAGDGSGGFPSLGEISSVSRPLRRGVLVRNLPADSQYEIRVVDQEYKLGVTAVVETIATIKDSRFALCRTKDPAAAILDELVFPMDVDSVQMAPLIRKANSVLRKEGLELLWSAHTLTVKGLNRITTDYLRYKKPFSQRPQHHHDHHEAAALAEGEGLEGEEEAAAGEEGMAVMEEGGEDDLGLLEEEDMDAMDDDMGLLLDGASYDRMDAAFFADVNDEEYVGDAPEGLDKRQVLVESDMMLAEFDYKRAKYKVVVYEEPVMLVAQWMEDDGTWRLLKSVEAELVEDAIAYQQLQNLEVELVDA